MSPGAAARRGQVAAALHEVEAELRRLGLWQAAPPFAIDTLELHQWLQFIGIPKLRALLECGAELPGSCGIAPMAEHAWGADLTTRAELLAALRRLDALFG